MKKNILILLSLFFNVFFIFFFSSQIKQTLPVSEKNESAIPVANQKSDAQVIGVSTSGSYDYVIRKVVDGDTVKLDNGQVLRYIGIDTPETVDPRKTVQCFGHEASVANQKLVEGKKVRLEKDVSERDKYGRLLRYVWVPADDGTEVFVNDFLVKQGFARAVSYPPDIKYQDLFRSSEKEAMQNGLGLWSSCGGPTSTPDPNHGVDDTGFINSNDVICDKNVYNCSDFKSQSQAQSVFEKCGGDTNDIHKLDSDKDGKVCETLP